MTAPRTPRKRVPASAPKPQDRKPKTSVAARQAEADGYAIVKQCGMTLKIPVHEDLMPLKAYMAFKAGDEIGGTELLLGAEQWTAFLAKNPTIGDFAAIGAKLQELAGNQ